MISMRLLRAGVNCEGVSKEWKDRLFRHACRGGYLLAVETLLKNVCNVGTLPSEEQGRLLHCAYCEGDKLVQGRRRQFRSGLAIVEGEEFASAAREK